ncbi:hypothetical protein A1O3_03842 [Capronia epimyces CBS 606.96]|uniref:G-patch domain-containing protein n=1 Tax=Capronia epimyces CBS 606.96 TaxID=1182542 RepID=W9Y331_9EURO|nr:uncharacterized protein A1O3_03842 [Capronia epimyces CBS 606.96]EXJ86888.1 hypothetical protein A1O3_03842 [Capronia epimyces CBS 606.96]
MDAQAHLLSLGWAGPGHSLDSRPYTQKGHRGLAYDPAKVGNNGNGLVKPLLVSQRKGRFGIGKKAHEPPAGTEWWLKGFESALGNIGKSESERTSGASTPAISQSQHNMSGKHGSLYSYFIKGPDMEGTIEDLDEMQGTIENENLDEMEVERSLSSKKKKKKRKSDVLDDDDTDTAAVVTKMKKSSKKQKRDAVVEFEQVSTYMALRDKDKQRRQRPERPSPVEEFRHVGEYLEAKARSERKDKEKKNEARSERKDKEKKKQKRKRTSEEAHESGPSTSTTTPAVTEAEAEAEEGAETPETKEERRERRRLRREQKEARKPTTAVAAEAHPSERLPEAEVEAADAADKAARRAERKKRKAEKAAIPKLQ